MRFSSSLIFCSPGSSRALARARNAAVHDEALGLARSPQGDRWRPCPRAMKRLVELLSQLQTWSVTQAGWRPAFYSLVALSRRWMNERVRMPVARVRPISHVRLEE